MTGSVGLLALTITGALVFGMLMVLLSCLQPQLALRLGVTQERVRGLWASMNLFLAPMFLAGGALIDVAGVRAVLIIGSLALTLSLAILAGAQTPGAARLAFLGIGLGGAFVACSTLLLMPAAYFGTREASASMNLGSVFFAVGALIAPALADVLLRTGGLKAVLGLSSFACFLPGLMAMVIRDVDLRARDTTPEYLASLSDPIMLLFAVLVFFLYAPLEGCLHTWGATFLKHMGHPEEKTPRLIAAFWSSFLLGRLVIGWFQHQRILPESWDAFVLVVLAVGSTVMLANMAGTARRTSATFGLLMLGFFLGPILPILAGMVFTSYPGEQGTAFGLVFAVGSLGSLLFAPLIGARFLRSSVQGAIRIPMVLGMSLMVTALVYGLLRG